MYFCSYNELLNMMLTEKILSKHKIELAFHFELDVYQKIEITTQKKSSQILSFFLVKLKTLHLACIIVGPVSLQ